MNNLLNNISNFIRNNKLITFLLAIVFLLITWVYIVPYFRSNKEMLEPNIVNNVKLQDTIGKYINLRCECELKEFKDNKIEKKKDTYYLAIAKRNDCSNIEHEKLSECGNGIVIIQKNKNNNSTFLLQKGFDQTDRYTLTTIVNDIYSGVLSQNLNYHANVQLPCFDGGLDDIVNFETEERNDGYLIKFRKLKDKTDQTKGYAYYYLGLCEASNDICNIGSEAHHRLCLFEESDKDKALGFQIEFADKQPKIIQEQEQEQEYKQEYIQEYIQEQEQEHKEHFSLFDSFLSSTGSTISLPGAMSQRMETFKPWIED